MMEMIDDVVRVICDKYELEYTDVQSYVKAVLMYAPLNAKPKKKQMTKVMPLEGFEGCLFDPITRKIYSEVAVE